MIGIIYVLGYFVALFLLIRYHIKKYQILILFDLFGLAAASLFSWLTVIAYFVSMLDPNIIIYESKKKKDES